MEQSATNGEISRGQIWCGCGHLQSKEAEDKLCAKGRVLDRKSCICWTVWNKDPISSGGKRGESWKLVASRSQATPFQPLTIVLGVFALLCVAGVFALQLSTDCKNLRRFESIGSGSVLQLPGKTLN
ncbi:uncharacterized protein LOC134219770 [Armigeres subalbatus]|uniref:uncharacterized protein LOC134219770 n=1 Tax=Armigeres subalbatus TaxID=124917 RepID=UPI002ED5AB99